MGLHRQLWKLMDAALSLGCELVVEWHRRDTLLGARADFMSKFVDNSAWELVNSEYLRIVAEFKRRDASSRTPMCDMAADASNYKTDTFISRVFEQGPCVGVDLFCQGEYLAGLRASNGRQALLYCNPPFVLMARVIAFINRFKLDVVLVYPQWPRPWLNSIEAHPARVGSVLELDGRQDLFKKGRRVQQSVKPPHRNFAVKAVLICWSLLAEGGKRKREP
jgi:hypothetical protein